MSAIEKAVTSAPPWAWVAATAVVGVAFLSWYHHFSDDASGPWNEVDQPPTQGDLSILPAVPSASGKGRPMDCCPGFRSRAGYPGILDVSLGFGLGGG